MALPPGSMLRFECGEFARVVVTRRLGAVLRNLTLVSSWCSVVAQMDELMKHAAGGWPPTLACCASEQYEADQLSKQLNAASKQVAALRKLGDGGSSGSDASELDALMARCRTLKADVESARASASAALEARDVALRGIGNLVDGAWGRESGGRCAGTGIWWTVCGDGNLVDGAWGWESGGRCVASGIWWTVRGDGNLVD
eukprot:354954-Chlamydomonas_euryale.AAC.13